MKKIIIILVMILVFTLTSCGVKQVTTSDFSNLLNATIEFQSDILKFVVDNNYGDKIKEIKYDEKNGLSLILKDEIFYNVRVIKDKIDTTTYIEFPNKEEYYKDVANLLYYCGDRLDYNELLQLLETNENGSFEDSYNKNVIIEHKNDKTYITK